jgi:hypothetical protein
MSTRFMTGKLQMILWFDGAASGALDFISSNFATGKLHMSGCCESEVSVESTSLLLLFDFEVFATEQAIVSRSMTAELAIVCGWET